VGPHGLLRGNIYFSYVDARTSQETPVGGNGLLQE
jgi:hypothetical protein